MAILRLGPRGHRSQESRLHRKSADIEYSRARGTMQERHQALQVWQRYFQYSLAGDYQAMRDPVHFRREYWLALEYCINLRQGAVAFTRGVKKVE